MCHAYILPVDFSYLNFHPLSFPLIYILLTWSLLSSSFKSLTHYNERSREPKARTLLCESTCDKFSQPQCSHL